MDKYLVKTPRENVVATVGPISEKRLTQTTIESLQGVVVVEDVLRWKAVLKLENQSNENIIEALQSLGKKIPSRTVLRSTKIGHTVNRLTKHRDDNIQALAGNLVKEWKKYFEEKLDRPMIEVRCDKQTEKLRKTGRKLLAGALSVSEDNCLVENIEREAFFQHNRLINNKYRVSMRSLVFTLKHQPNVRERVLKQELKVSEFVQLYKKMEKNGS